MSSSSISNSSLLEENIQRAILSGYVAVKSQKDIDNLEKNMREDIGKFASRIEKHSSLVFKATEHLQTYPIIGCTSFESTGVILDQDIPEYAILLCLFTMEGKTKVKIPTPSELIYNGISLERKNLFSHISNKSDVQCNPYQYDLSGIHYILFRYKRVVAEVVNNRVIIHDQHELDKQLQRRSGMNRMTIITEEMIDEVITEGVIPEKYRATLMEHVGRKLVELLLYDIGLWGNLSRQQEINREELTPANVEDFRLTTNRLLAYYDRQERTLERSIWADKKSMKKDFGNLIDVRVKQVYKYLKGKRTIESLNVTPSNALLILTILKTIDWETESTNCLCYNPVAYSPRKDAALRSRIVKLVPKLKSHEAFLRTLNPAKIRDPRHWVVPGSFTNESAAQYALALVMHYVAADTLSRSGSLRGLYGVRGPSGVGKSTYIRDYIIANYAGVMNPDNLKWFIKHDPAGLGDIFFNSQVHELGKELYGLLLEIMKEDPQFMYVLDERLLTAELILKKLIEPAKKKGCSVFLPDLECTSIICPMLRMLLRDPMGQDPTPTTEVLVRGCKESIQNRSEVIKLVKESDEVWEYKLILDGILVAEKNGQIWVIHDEEAYKKCTEFSLEVEARILEETHFIIDEDLLDFAIRKKYIRAVEKDGLMQWAGRSLRQAVDSNALGIKP